MTGGSGEPWDFRQVDDVCFDLCADPALLVTKLVQVLSDSVNGTTNPKSIPGAVTRYTIAVANQGAGSVDNGTVVVEDVVPANTALFVDTGAGDPLQFVDGPTASGLSDDFAMDVTFSNQPEGGAPFDYTTVPDADGFDPAVTLFGINSGGAINGSSRGNDPCFNIRFRARVE